MLVLAKAVGDRRRVEQLLAKAEASVRRAFRRFLDDARSPQVTRLVRQELERGGIEGGLAVLDAYSARLASSIPPIFQAVGIAEAADLARQVARRQPGIGLSFDPTHPRAAALMRRNRLEFIQGFSGKQRQATRAALSEAFQTGAGPIQAARAFRASIGLTETQRRAVANYRNLLEAGDAAVLSRDIRDRRFDPSVRRMLEDEEPLGAERISRMVERYRERYLTYRAETIARTESLRVLGQAREEALRQVVDDVGLPRGAVRRVWRATMDARVRDTHAAMDGQEVGQDEPFESPSGALLMFPGDPSAPPEEVINCRCTVLTEITPPE